MNAIYPIESDKTYTEKVNETVWLMPLESQYLLLVLCNVQA